MTAKCHLLRQELKKKKKQNRNKHIVLPRVWHIQCLCYPPLPLLGCLTECCPSAFLQPPKNYQTTLGQLLAAQAELWDELQIQTVVVAFMIEHHSHLPFLGPFQRDVTLKISCLSGNNWLVIIYVFIVIFSNIEFWNCLFSSKEREKDFLSLVLM